MQGFQQFLNTFAANHGLRGPQVNYPKRTMRGKTHRLGMINRLGIQIFAMIQISPRRFKTGLRSTRAGQFIIPNYGRFMDIMQRCGCLGSITKIAIAQSVDYSHGNTHVTYIPKQHDWRQLRRRLIDGGLMDTR